MSIIGWAWRFTPTLVGKTDKDKILVGERQVHPHACGENSRHLMAAFSPVGSPPRLWGKHHTRALDGLPDRFTPTLVGKTKVLHGSGGMRPVHPHACGENYGKWICHSRGAGSPPRLWGKPHLHQRLNVHLRFTPTLVGKTTSPARLGAPPTVHPHACGENAARSWTDSRIDGSPPRLWGKPSAARWQRRLGRFTPTLVGKTIGNATMVLPIEVHPHACGENATAWLALAKRGGSPPRLWGKQPVGNLGLG